MKINEEVSLAMAEYREIITKAVVAKGRKFTKSNHTIKPLHNPSSILGCWIINHTYEAEKIGKKVEVQALMILTFGILIIIIQEQKL